MSSPTGISLNDYCKALEICAVERGYGYLKHGYNKGSVYSFQLFQNKDDATPCVVWAIHFRHNKKKELYQDDLAKAWKKTAIPKDRFLEVIRSL